MGHRILFFLLCFGLLVSCSSNGRLVKKQYVVACPSQWTSIPLFGQDKQVGGYLVDLMQEIAIRADLDVRVILVPEADIPGLIEKKSISGYFSAMPKAFRSEKEYDFSSPFFSSGFLLVVKNDSSKKSLEECANMNIGYTSEAAYYLQSTTHPAWREYLYDTVYAALDDVIKGRIEGVVMDSLDMQILSQGYYSGSFRPILPPIFLREVRLISPKALHQEALIESVDESFKDAVVQETKKQLLEYWALFSLT